MKTLLAVLTAAFVIGCAGMGFGPTDNTTADYYMTSDIKGGWQTVEWDLKEDLPIVVDYNKGDKQRTEDYDVDIDWFWYDTSNGGCAIKYTEIVGNQSSCAIFYFTTETFEMIIGPDYMDADLVHFEQVDCERLEEVRDRQIAHGPYMR